ncbi:PQQ-dependent sugar dehydrogenase [Hymenobacter sp. BT188]|uniref:PKD domain-containing protein n=1 Tax=Hymenobacter sp. BT188 TaxID=2763504 RepID=UPI001650DB97|nr:malectin domain-containing carbohydrate-binding protein [Hymenobacter sp. BT188]MBC6607573.1 PQQ-dependent sugar dehydrogenase [Hymenobacter sp. BT188]
MLGFALHPDFDTNGYFYLFYTVDRHHLMNFGTSNYSPTTDEYFNATINRLTRYTATKTTTGYTVSAASRKVLLGATRQTGVPILHQSHGPGTLVFGTDGTLLLSTGDGASYDGVDVGSSSNTYYAQALADGIIPSEQNVGSFRSQQLESYNGKVMRLDPETGNGLPSNPFYNGNAASVQSKVWALSLRNPFRMALKPGSGSTLPSDGRPGVLYIGDVGFYTWEELNIATKPGMNFGWPLYEGLMEETNYINWKTYNPYAPNPAYGTAGCSQQYLSFQDLIKQQTASGTATYLNPCTGQALPTSVRTFMHSRPAIDWKHGDAGPSRTGTFNGETATTTNLNDPASPVTGSLFGGSAAVGGAFYTANEYPPEYRNTCFFGDYTAGFIRNISVDGTDKPLAVKDFINNGAVVVSMAAHPTDGSLYYVSFAPSEIRKILYRAPDRAPIAVASADKTFGLGPLTVQFTGDKSYDPDGKSITYQWNFGDGGTSTLANPTHTYATGNPANYTVTLTVRDNSLSGQTSLVISANNTPPQVTITSPADGTKYPMDKGNVSYPLRASVTDPQHSGSQLKYEWQTTLHHDDHNHPEPVDTNPETSTTITPLGCGAETYFYRISLTVTDALGLATKQEVTLYPDCSSLPPGSAVYRINAGGPAVGQFSADQYFTSTGGGVYTSPNPVSGTSNPTIYQSERWGQGTLNYAFPVTNGQYTVVLHFAEIWYTAAGQRVFDASLENTKVLTAYDIVKKVGSFTATTETFPVSVTDGVLNVNLSSLNPGNIENPKISAIEVLSASSTNQPPTANAGDDKTITLPTNSVTLNGQGSDTDGTISSYSWTKTNGPSATLSGATTPNLAVSGMAAGSYTFRLTVTDNGGATAFDDVNVTVNSAPAPPPTGPQIASFTLINVTTGQGTTLTEGGVIDLTQSTYFNIRANPGASTVSRVDFTLSGTERRTNSDRSVPFTLITNNTWRPQVGTYTLAATPFATNGNGSAGTASTINFRVANGATALQTSAALQLDKAKASTEDQVRYYPNPFTDEFTLLIQAKSTAKHAVKLSDMVGREVVILEDVPNGKHISLGKKLPAGVYTLTIRTGVKVKHYRLIKAN